MEKIQTSEKETKDTLKKEEKEPGIKHDGCIYKVTCTVTNLSYIGQTTLHKDVCVKGDLVGAEARWYKHVRTAMAKSRVNDVAPLLVAIRKHGQANFKVETIETCKIKDLNEREKHYIKFLNTKHPNGYNVSDGGGFRERVYEKNNIGNIVETYIDTATFIDVRPIKRNGEYRLIHVYITEDDEEDRCRLVFGQGCGSSFEIARKDMEEFIRPFKERCIEVRMDPQFNKEDEVGKYREKLFPFKDQTVTKVRVATMKCHDAILIAVYVSLEGKPGWKNDIRTLFGGDTIPIEKAYKTAKLFVNHIPTNEKTKFIDTVDLKKVQVGNDKNTKSEKPLKSTGGCQ